MAAAHVYYGCSAFCLPGFSCNCLSAFRDATGERLTVFLALSGRGHMLRLQRSVPQVAAGHREMRHEGLQPAAAHPVIKEQAVAGAAAIVKEHSGDLLGDNSQVARAPAAHLLGRGLRQRAVQVDGILSL